MRKKKRENSRKKEFRRVLNKRNNRIVRIKKKNLSEKFLGFSSTKLMRINTRRRNLKLKN